MERIERAFSQAGCVVGSAVREFIGEKTAALDKRAEELNAREKALDERETKITNRERATENLRQDLSVARCAKKAAEEREEGLAKKLEIVRQEKGVLAAQLSKIREAFPGLLPE